MTQHRPVCVRGHTGEGIRGGSEQVDQVCVLGRGMQMIGKSKSGNQTDTEKPFCAKRRSPACRSLEGLQEIFH